MLAKRAEQEAEYIRNKAFDDQYYQDLIVQYLKKYERAQKKDFRKLLLDKLPDSMSSKQKEYKIGNLLSSMRKKGIIKTDSPNRQSGYWVLA